MLRSLVFDQNVIGPIGLMHNWPLWPYNSWTWHCR